MLESPCIFKYSPKGSENLEVRKISREDSAPLCPQPKEKMMTARKQHTLVASEVIITEVENGAYVSIVVKNGDEKTLYEVVPKLSVKDTQATAIVSLNNVTPESDNIIV